LCSQRPILGSIPEENLAGKIIIQNKVGFRVNPDDGQEFIKKAEILLDLDHDLLKEFGRNARNYAEQNFNIIDIGNKFEEFFNRL
jgi:glycosyltransferase involved in cell wall biosynthesis